MKFTTLLTGTLVSTGIVLSAVATPAFAGKPADVGGGKPDGAAVLGQCVDAIATFGASGCLGQLSGNDDGVGLENTLKTLATEWGGTWTKADKWDADNKTNESGILTLTGGTTSGTFNFSGITGPFALGVKASDAYNLFYFDSAAQATKQWTTLGLINNGGNTPGLSHLTLYTGGPQKEVPEPLTLLGSGLALGFGGYFQKKRSAKKSAQ